MHPLTRVEGVVKEKEKALEEYKAAIENGEKSAYCRYSSEGYLFPLRRQHSAQRERNRAHLLPSGVGPCHQHTLLTENFRAGCPRWTCV